MSRWRAAILAAMTLLTAAAAFYALAGPYPDYG